MAIYHCSTKPVSRRSGRSAVAAAAYRAGERLENARDGLVHDFTRRDGVVHAEIVLPRGVDAVWARDRSALWNAAEQAEARKDARVAREFEIALPHELSADERIALARSFAQDLADRTGAAVDVAVHAPHQAGDVRNHHAHLLMTTRRIEPVGLGEKTALERENRWLLAHGLPTTDVQLVGIRQAWEAEANAHLARAGLEIRIDHRSHAERGLELAPTEHVGVQATQMRRRGAEAERARLDAQAAERNAALIRERPEHVLDLIIREKSVFDQRDLARALFRYINDPATFEAVRLRIGLSPELVAVSPEVIDPDTDAVIERARWTTRAMLRTELAMQTAAARLWTEHAHEVRPIDVNAALAGQNNLSEQQREAVRHVVGPERIAAVVGFAGAGKSTMLGVAQNAWNRAGHRVLGAALAGKAADGLQRSAGIASRTVASWELAWSKGQDLLQKGDVLVLDEAGMVSSQQLARVVQEVERRGAKLVLVGDAMQLQPIEAGAAFRAITEAVGYAELGEIWRQSDPRMREATIAFARGDTAAAIGIYRARDLVRFTATREAAREALIAAWKTDYLAQKPDGRRMETLILAHINQDVFTLNAMARAALKAEGQLADEARFMTARGERLFAIGDRVLFLENDARLGVKNGMLATVVAAEAGRLSVRLDQDGVGDGRTLEVEAAACRNIDHGYAATVHKSQGATLDRVHVLATPGMDMHLAYVAMTRHRDSAVLHAAHADFISERTLDRLAGKLGAAPGKVDHDAAALAGLVRRLSRDGSKETTLDYLDREVFREAAVGLGTLATGPSLADLARALDAAEAREQLTADRVRPKDLRALASAFAERRGLNSHATVWPGVVARLRGLVQELGRRRAALKDLGDRLGAAMAGMRAQAQPPAAAVQPTAPGLSAAKAMSAAPDPFLPAVDLGDHGLEEAAVARVTDLPAITRARDDLARAIAEVVQDPQPLLAAILAELRQPAAVFEERVEALLHAPERFGGLHGKTGLLASREARAARERASGAVPRVSHQAALLKDQFDAHLADARRAISADRAAMQISVPGLSVAAQEALRAVAQAKFDQHDQAIARIVSDPALWPEVEGFACAVGERFGRYGAVGHNLEPRLPPGHDPVTPELRALMNGAGFMALHIQRAAEDSDSVIQPRDLKHYRDPPPPVVRVSGPDGAATLIPPRHQATAPSLRPEAIDAYLARHPRVRGARSGLEVAAAKVFHDPARAVDTVVQRRDPEPRRLPPPEDEALHGRRTVLGDDKARKAARAALPAFERAARDFQAATAQALAELTQQAEQQARGDLIPVPAPSVALATALATCPPRAIAADDSLMAEARTIQDTLYERYGRPGAAILATGNPEEAAKLLPEGMALDELRAVLKPLRETVLAEQDLAYARTQSRILSRGAELGYGR